MHPGRGARLVLVACAALAADIAPAGAQVALRNMVLQAHRNDFPGQEFSACWSYVHGDGREYAILGTTTGTAIYNVTMPAATSQVGFIAGPTSDWREMKSYREWLYIVTESSGNPDEGVQIVSMANPESPLLVATYKTNFVTAHTVSVDTARAILICNGTRNKAGKATGMRILSLANPTAPVELTWWPGGGIPVLSADYIHDSEPIGNRLYGSSIYSGIQRIFDFTNPAAIAPIAQWTYPKANLTHSAWPDASGNCLYVTDEENGQPLRVFDITTPGTPTLVNTFTPHPSSIVHNPRVVGIELYLANYTEGVRVLDISDPHHPAEFAYADSWAGASGGYFGVWEACPYFPSGTVIASDINSGLYIYTVQRNYGVIRVKVVDQATSTPLAGIRVYRSPGADSAFTSAAGVVQFAPDPGTHTIQAVRVGYPGASANVTVTAGSRDTVIFSIPTGALAGTVRDASTLVTLEDAEIEVEGFGAHAHTDAAGQYAFSLLPADQYTVQAHAPGYVPQSFDRLIGPAYGGQNFLMTPTATWDALETDLGWTAGIPFDDATTGEWVRGEPVGSGVATSPALIGRTAQPFHDDTGEGQAPGDIQPELDRTPPPGSQCFVTGQGVPGGGIGDSDIDNGRTTLISPALNLASMSDPVIGYWRWFYTRDADGSDWFAVEISNNNGSSWVPIETMTTGAATWVECAVRVLDYVTPSTQVKIRFIAADLAPGGIVEAAVDDLVTYEAGLFPLGSGPAPQPARLAWRAPWPNPTEGAVNLALAVPAAGPVSVDVLDVAGRRRRSLYRGAAAAGTLAMRWNGADDRGARVPAGLYLVRARARDAEVITRVVRVE